ncbi:MAG: replication factor C large subunit [Candidatus Hodarchaeota archaeon]
MGPNNLPWPEKHRPTSMDQVAGNQEVIRKLENWVRSWISGQPTKKAALLLGPPGVGKTASVGALSLDFDLEIVEFNSSDKRNKGIIEDQVWKAATQQTLDGRIRIILLDEVDGLSGTSDRGGVGAIAKVIDDTVYPIIMTANDPNNPRLKDIIKKCQVFIFESIDSKDMMVVLREISNKNRAQVTDEVLEEIVERAGGDLRAAISDLETLVISGQEGGLPARDAKRGIKEVFRRLFMTTDPSTARKVISELDVDHDQLLLWLEENAHLHLVSFQELDLGLDYLSLADMSLGRISKRQNWKLLSYVYDFLSAGIATSRNETPYRRVDYSEPTWPLLLWRGKKNRDREGEILSKLASNSAVSEKRVLRTHRDAISSILDRNPSGEKDFVEWLKLKRGFPEKRSSR